MKITKDGKGKHIIDFEGLDISFDVDECVGINGLFNNDTVSEIRNGNFYDLTNPVCVVANVNRLRENEK